jgi:hypothetical protein
MLQRVASFEIVAAGAMLATAGIFLAQESGTAALLPLILTALAVTVPTALTRAPRRVVAGGLFLLLVLDEERARAFTDHEAFTELLGAYLYTSVGGVRGYELVTLALVGFFAARDVSTRVWRTGRKRLLLGSVGGLGAAVAAGLALGLARGHDVGLMAPQVRTLPLLLAWSFVGFALARRVGDFDAIFGAVTAAMVLKAAQGLWVYAVVLGGELGDREYLIDHLSSFFMVIAILYLAGRWLLGRRHGWHDAGLAGALALIGLPYLVNDRRASFLGVGLSAIVLLLPLRRQIRPRHLAGLALAALLAAALLAATWGMPGALGIPARTLASIIDDQDGSNNYRKLENHNLYHEIMAAPLTGLGFGQRFRKDTPMPDISGIFPMWDVLPHNSLLGFWAFAGPLGAAALATFLAAFALVSSRLMRYGCARGRLVGALLLVTLVTWSVFVVFDIGLQEIKPQVLLGLLFGMAVRLVPLQIEPRAPKGLKRREHKGRKD